MKKAILLAALVLSACNSNDSRPIRTTIETKHGAEVTITSCSVVIGRETVGDESDPRWYNYRENAHVIVGNRSTKTMRVEINLDAIGKDGSVLSGTIIEGNAKAGTTTNLDGMKSVPAPVNFVENGNYIGA